MEIAGAENGERAPSLNRWRVTYLSGDLNVNRWGIDSRGGNINAMEI